MTKFISALLVALVLASQGQAGVLQGSILSALSPSSVFATVSGDCSIDVSGVITCTQAGGGTGAFTAGRFIVAGSTIATNGIYLPTTNTVGISANSLDVMRLTAAASAVNYITAGARATGSGPTLYATGSDTNIHLVLASKGSNAVRFATASTSESSWVEQARVSHTASAVNYLNLTGAATTAAPAISAQGTDTNIGLTISGKGTGAVSINSVSVSSASAVSGISNLATSRTSGNSATFTTTNEGDNYIAFVTDDVQWNIGVGADETLQIYGNGGYRMILSSLGVLTLSNYGAGTLSTNASGVVSATSDARLKIDDGYFSNGLEKLMALKPRYFFWKDKDGMGSQRELGFYAQDVHKALGEEAAPTPKARDDGNGGYFTPPWAFYDRAVIAALVSAVQELKKDNDNLEVRVKNLEKNLLP